ncbi:MAG: hypothetical protein IJQ99_00995, partial [Synergistaceae bacterium]|nr:hypothetical protein [Synergistaceae bacterium]
MASMSVSGVVSGMDWESMITSTIEAAQEPAMVKVNKRTNLTNKKSLFEEMKVMMQSIQTSLTSLKLPSTYKAKDIEIENMGTGSYKKILTATVNADAEIGVHTLEVKQLATAQTNRSKQISSTLKSTMGSLESSKMYINVGSQKIAVDVYNTDTLESLKSRINTTLKTLSTPVNVTAAVVDNKLVIKSDSTGLGTTTVEGTLPNKYNAGGRNSLESIITNAGSGATTNIYVDGDAAENLKVSSGGSSYTIHEDYEVVNNEIRWKQYKDTDEIKLGDSVGATYKMAANDKVIKTVTRGSGDTDTVSLNFTPSDNSNFKIAAREVSTSESISATKPSSSELGTSKPTTDDDGNEVVITKTYSENTDDDGNTYYTITTTTTTTKYYTYGTDFTYSDGKITWLNEESKTNEPSSYTVSYEKDTSTNYSLDVTRGSGDDSIDITELLTKYKAATGSELGTKTLTGTDRVIRTYIDPDDTSLLNITDGTNTYEYGRDFVIRVKDDGDGYVVSWFAKDNTVTASDANPAVSAYTDYKDISTLNFKTAPTSNYTLNFKYSDSETTSAAVKSSDTDKSLKTILSLDDDIASSEYSKITIKNGSTTYTYGTDYTINSDGEIEWLDVSAKTPSGDFTVNYKLGGYKPFTINNKYRSTDATVNQGLGTSFLLSDLELETFQVGSYDCVTSDVGEKVFTLKLADGSDSYTYGTDYIIRNNAEGSLAVSWPGGVGLPAGSTHYPPANAKFTLSYNPIASGQSSVGASDTVSGLLGFTPTSYEDVYITDDDGNTYTYGKDFTVNDDGTIEWLEVEDPSRPTASTEYELIYTSTDGGELFTISDAVTRSNSDVIALTSSGSSIDYDEMINGTVTITQGSKVFYENYDFEIGKNDNGEVTIDWKTGTNYEWYYPQPGANSRYSINLVTADGDTKTYSGVRSYTDTLDLRSLSDDCYFEVAEGSLTKLTYNNVTYDLTDAADDDETTTTDVEIVRDTLGLSIADGTNGGKKIFNFNWVTPDLEARDNLPTYGDEIEISYDYYANTFTLSDDGDGIIDKLGLNDDVTDAKNAIIVL